MLKSNEELLEKKENRKKEAEEKTDETDICSFCGKERKNVRYLIKGDNASICDKCVVSCISIIVDKNPDFMKEKVFTRQINGIQHNLMYDLNSSKFTWGTVPKATALKE